MFRITLIIGIFISAIIAFENQTETMIDLYNRINTSGSILKATSFDRQIQSKLKSINTIRMVSYKVSHRHTLIAIKLKRKLNEQIALIELQCNSSNVYVQLNKYGYKRKYHLPIISTMYNQIQSFDLTRFLSSNQNQRIIYLKFKHSIANSNLSIVYYSKSFKNLFSLTTNKNIRRRFRRTILSDNPNLTCAKHEYEIDFNQFPFGQWILQPKRFNAYTCSGSCPNPLSPHLYPSNHAILLSLVRSQRDYGQQALCVPVRLKPLCLLYYEKDELVIKYHRDMIVQECGCR